MRDTASDCVARDDSSLVTRHSDPPAMARRADGGRPRRSASCEHNLKTTPIPLPLLRLPTSPPRQRLIFPPPSIRPRPCPRTTYLYRPPDNRPCRTPSRRRPPAARTHPS
ncbi:hypothetical protein DAEQUDRAFT_324865 [Daedalea quercina L-15889]|uniref:Uncharacterized protein n=1 Tax=Daedalea quercina L-15889 TaxID=1314783 RepID=A0A165PUA9_9APHY|nr:hypothetical protein DAEQUDRAFT_324865 [Daedalea quercina L-15889]